MFGSLTLPYELGTVASFDYTGFNGRALRDNVMDTMLSLLTNSPLGTGIAPDPDPVLPHFSLPTLGSAALTRDLVQVLAEADAY